MTARTHFLPVGYNVANAANLNHRMPENLDATSHLEYKAQEKLTEQLVCAVGYPYNLGNVPGTG